MLDLAATTAFGEAVAVREVVIVAFPGVQALDVAGPAEVFAQAGPALTAFVRERVASFR